MRLSFSNRHNTPSEEAGQVIDIDVTPIMNMLVVLIPILISMAVFTHYSVHKFFLPSNAGSNLSQDQGPVKLKTTVLVDSDYLLIAVGGEQVDSLQRGEGGYREEDLLQALAKGRAQSDDTAKVVISVRDKVEFESAVEVMDYCRSAGFANVGLSSAPEAE